MMAVVRTPAGLAALTLPAVGVGYALLGAWLSRHGTSPAADPWLVALLVLAGLVLLTRLLVRARQAQVDAHQLARHPERAYVRAVSALPGASALSAQPGVSDSRRPAAAANLQISDTTRRSSVRDLPSRRRLSGLGALVGALALVAALLVASVLITRAADADLMDNGTRVQGQVVAGGWDYAGRGPRGFVDVRYAGGPAGEQRGRIHGLDPLATPVGTQVPVVFHPADPSRVAAEEVPNHSHAYELWVSLLLLSLLGLGVALALAVRHHLARRRALATGGWVRVPAVVGRAGRDGVPVGLDVDGTWVVGRVRPGAQPIEPRTSLDVLLSPEHLPTSVLVRRGDGVEPDEATELPEPTEAHEFHEVDLPRTLAEAERLRGRLGLGPAEPSLVPAEPAVGMAVKPADGTPSAARSSVGSS